MHRGSYRRRNLPKLGKYNRKSQTPLQTSQVESGMVCWLCSMAPQSLKDRRPCATISCRPGLKVKSESRSSAKSPKPSVLELWLQGQTNIPTHLCPPQKRTKHRKDLNRTPSRKALCEAQATLQNRLAVESLQGSGEGEACARRVANLGLGFGDYIGFRV